MVHCVVIFIHLAWCLQWNVCSGACVLDGLYGVVREGLPQCLGLVSDTYWEAFSVEDFCDLVYGL